MRANDKIFLCGCANKMPSVTLVQSLAGKLLVSSQTCSRRKHDRRIFPVTSICKILPMSGGGLSYECIAGEGSLVAMMTRIENIRRAGCADVLRIFHVLRGAESQSNTCTCGTNRQMKHPDATSECVRTVIRHGPEDTYPRQPETKCASAPTSGNST